MGRGMTLNDHQGDARGRSAPSVRPKTAPVRCTEISTGLRRVPCCAAQRSVISVTIVSSLEA